MKYSFFYSSETWAFFLFGIWLFGYLITVLSAYIIGKKNGEKISQFRKYGISVISIIFVVFLYWSIFGRYFYGINIKDQSSMQIIYVFPERNINVDIEDIREILMTPHYKGNYQVQIILKDGRTYNSVPAFKRDVDEKLRFIQDNISLGK